MRPDTIKTFALCIFIFITIGLSIMLRTAIDITSIQEETIGFLEDSISGKKEIIKDIEYQLNYHKDKSKKLQSSLIIYVDTLIEHEKTCDNKIKYILE